MTGGGGELGQRKKLIGGVASGILRIIADQRGCVVLLEVVAGSEVDWT
jgi:hypothetical protein